MSGAKKDTLDIHDWNPAIRRIFISCNKLSTILLLLDLVKRLQLL